jgi:hypothetical protein
MERTEGEENRRGLLPDFLLRKTMNTNTNSWLSRNKWIFAVVGIPVLVAAWWAFRPEKLFINQTVSEAAPAAPSSELETGAFHGRVHKTSGRATVYQEADGKLVLRLTNFKTSNGPDVRVVLVAAQDADVAANSFKSDMERLELGKMKGNEGDQNYEIPGGTDLTKFHVVSIYCVRFNANFGTAPLEKF